MPRPGRCPGSLSSRSDHRNWRGRPARPRGNRGDRVRFSACRRARDGRTHRTGRRDLDGLTASARETVDATDLLVLPGAVDVHTHTRVATDALNPIGSSRISVAAAFGGTTTFLAFNTPGTGSSPAAERSRRCRVARVARPRPRRTRLSTSGSAWRPRAGWITQSPNCLPSSMPASRHCKAFMVFDFRLDPESASLRGDARCSASGRDAPGPL